MSKGRFTPAWIFLPAIRSPRRPKLPNCLAERLPERGGKFIQMEDEIASMCAIIGASLTGKKVMTATSGPGFSLKQEAIGYACMAEIPCVIANVQRGGPSTGNPTHVSQGDINQARWGTHGDHYDHRPDRLQPSGCLYDDRRRLQYGRDLPDAGHPAV